MVRRVAGCMTGTSLDAVDAAVVRLAGEGLSMSARVESFATGPMGPAAETLRSLALGGATTAAEACAASLELSRSIAAALLDAAGERGVAFAAVHGQTLWHAPPASWQMLTPAVIARAIGAPVVSDLRAMDLACGGQGAPITPLADAVLFGSASSARTVVNLGGFINVTHLPAGRASDAGYLERVRACDVCACNRLLDAAARAGLGVGFDDGGRAAMAAVADEVARREFLDLLMAQRRAGRSLGNADEPEALVRRLAAGVAPGGSLARAACEAIAVTLASELAGGDEVLLAGGGVRNGCLVAEIERAVGRPVRTTAACGVASEAREAAAMAVLGAMAADGVAITLAGVTGRGAALLVDGSWTGGFPGRGRVG